MSRTIFIIAIILASAVSAFGQVDWYEHPIATGYDRAAGIYAVDMDYDSDIDILSAGNGIYEVTWWENDGTQTFTQRIVDQHLDGVHQVHAGDLDSDGDMDVIGVSFFDGIAWYENDGQMNFTKYTLVQNYWFAHFARMHDLDNDGDMDIVACSWGSRNVAWWENTGYPNFTRHDIDNAIAGCRQVDVSDLDNDGDNDILAAADSSVQIVWYENDGNQAFQRRSIQYNYTAFWAKPYDFNNDGAWDILGSDASNNEISWWQNDGNMNFTKYIIEDNFPMPQSVEATDLDLDGDLDIVSASRIDDEIAWWENQNNSIFTEHIIRSGYDYPIYVFLIDIDFDGDTDVIANAYLGNMLTWWENLLIFIPGYIVGNVSDENSVPVESVYVQASGTGFFGYTDEYGDYELALNVGTYDIIFQKPGYYEYTVYDVPVTQGDTTIVDAILYAIPAPCSSCIRGIVSNRESVEIESVYVSAVGTGIHDYSNYMGMYSLEGLSPDIYDVHFSHATYSDTTALDIQVTSDTVTVLNMVIESNSAISGVVADTGSQPIAGALVDIPELNLHDHTDSSGEYFIRGIVPGNPYDVYFSHFNYMEEILHDVVVAVNETLVLDTVYLSYEVIVWYGKQDLSPVMARIGDTILVDVWIKCDPYVGFIHLPLGTDDQYIAGHHSVTDGVFYYPLTDWDHVEFLPPDELSPGWHSQSLLGFYDTTGGPNPPLQSSEPIRIASFAFEIANDTSLIGNTVICLMEGDNPANGGPLYVDVNGVDPYYPDQLFSPLYFVAATGCDYVVGDVNGSYNYNGLDITYAVGYFKYGAPEPQCPFGSCPIPPCDAFFYCGDVNASCNYNGLDITYGVNYFKYGSSAPQPCAYCPPVE
jgi:hypothetical protein